MSLNVWYCVEFKTNVSRIQNWSCYETAQKKEFLKSFIISHEHTLCSIGTFFKLVFLRYIWETKTYLRKYPCGMPVRPLFMLLCTFMSFYKMVVLNEVNVLRWEMSSLLIDVLIHILESGSSSFISDSFTYMPCQSYFIKSICKP